MPDSSTRRILTSNIAATPWKNGGGVTREIATGNPPAGNSGWGWRVSLAEVAQDGPFSTFPDTDRVIAVIEGAGMDLVHPDGSTVALEPFHPVRFAGEVPFSGRLRGGAVRDLNVMVLRSTFEAEMACLQGPLATTFDVKSGGCLIIHNLTAPCVVRKDDGEPFELALSESLVHEGRGDFDVRIAAGGRAMVIRVGRLEDSE